ncbi:MAG TPA: ABC transporter permease/substrate-binding protein [Vicinamibacterales bacterium]|nr:ABC transporter permease/substrate-binding protein [Vicinamibacterales bacterium]
MTALVDFWIAHRAELAVLTAQHLFLVTVSTAVAVLVGIPAGVLAARQPRLGRAVVLIANVTQTIPSLALLGFLLPLPFIGGIGARTALVALSIYALLPIVRTTAAGIQNINPAVREAGIAVGMTSRQLLFQVELPLAVPAIIAGVRVATVIGVGTATIAAAVGAGGLGELIFRGLSMVDTTTILAGAIPAAALALAADAQLGAIEHVLRPGSKSSRRWTLRPAAVGLVVIGVIAGAIAAAGAWSARNPRAVVVGSKNFTEQVILGELIAQSLEDEGVAVVRKLNLGGTFVCDRGIRSGDIDVYVEYTGTAVSAVFHESVPHDPSAAYERTRQLYAAAGVTAARPLGFNNTFTVLVRSADAVALGLHTVGDLATTADRWTPGFGYEFLQRDDGYPGLLRAYGLRFARQPRAMDLSLIYRALADRQVDVIAGDATSALIDALQLTPLVDDRKYFPPYDAVPLVRTSRLLAEPAIGRALVRLAGAIDDRQMRRLNAEVDLEHRDVAQSVRAFLERVPRSGS